MSRQYLDTIVIKHNKILDLVGLHGKNKYNCFLLNLWTRLYIYYFIIYLWSKTVIVLCNTLNSQKIAGNIMVFIVNKQCHRKVMFSGAIDLNPGPVFLY
jgi:hypothetical protein